MDVSKASARKGVRVRIPLPAHDTPGSGGCRTVGGYHDNELRVSPAYGRIRITPVEPGRDGLGRMRRFAASLFARSAHWRYGTRQNAATAVARCPRCDGKELAEDAYAYLLGLYLGDGHITHGRRDVYALNMKCSNAWPALIEAAQSAMAAVMPTSSVFRVARPGCVEVKSWSKHWPCLFPQHGPGKKAHPDDRTGRPGSRQSSSPPRSVRPRACFTPTAAGSSSRVRRPLAGGDRWYEYPRYMFTNESADILGLCGQALDRARRQLAVLPSQHDLGGAAGGGGAAG